MTRSFKRAKTEVERVTVQGTINLVENNTKIDRSLIKESGEGQSLIRLEIDCPLIDCGLQDMERFRVFIGKDNFIYISIGTPAVNCKITPSEDDAPLIESLIHVINTTNASVTCKIFVDVQIRIEIQVFAEKSVFTSLKDVPTFILHFFYLLGYVTKDDFETKGKVAKCILDRSRTNKSHQVQHPLMTANLYHYQIDCVDWMLEREGVCITSSGEIQSIPIPKIPLSIPVGNFLYLNLMDFTIDIDNGKEMNYDEIRGGLLNDEMGLGKTLMVLSTVLLNPLRPSTQLSEASDGKFVSKSTVIITPTTILYQWVDEMKHTPSLTFMIYEGQEEDADGIPIDHTYMSQFDIILTTYQFLQKEYYKALPPPTRSRRTERKYDRKPSILGDTYFYRVVLDEAQMVEKIHSNATKMAGLIKREISWGVTGTPCPRTGSIHDMKGLFDFIQSSFASPRAERFYNCLPEPIIAKALEPFTHRNSKHNVENELTLPEQRDTAITLRFNAIEDQFYNDSLEQALDNFPAKPVMPENTFDKKAMKAYHDDLSARLRFMEMNFVRLRKICCHPRIGAVKRKGPLGGRPETMQDVLEAMLRRTAADIHSSGRHLVLNYVQEGQLLEKEGNFAAAVELYKKQLPGVRSRISELNTELGTESHPESLENTKIHLNLWKEMLHKLCFFIGGASHQQGDQETEDEYYRLAEEIRTDLLQEAKKGVEKHSKITMDFYNKNTPMLQKEVLYPVEFSGGIYSRDLFVSIEAVEDKLNDQIEVIFSWRDEIKRLLMEPLEERDEEGPTGEEFLAGIIQQEKCMAYQDELANLIQYRRDTLLFDPKEYSKCDSCSTIIAQGHLADCSHRFCDKCKANLATDLKGVCPCPICFEEIVVADMEVQSFTFNFRKLPVTEVKNDFQAKLRSETADLALGETYNSYKTLTMKVKSLSKNSSLISQERRLATVAYEHLSTHLEIQTKHLKCLEAELEHFVDLFNERVKYYRQLQKISDTVLEVEFDQPAEVVREELKESSAQISTKITSLLGRKRYLAYLAKEGENEANNSHRSCGICHNDVQNGMLTTCGHLACDDCTKKWVMKRKKCTVCNLPVDPATLVAVSFKSKPGKSKDPKQANSHFEDEFVNNLKKMKLVDSYGTKIDMIVRHIKHLLENDPTVKVLCFSQWDDVLIILGEALKRQEIGWISLEGKGYDPSLKSQLTVKKKGQSVSKFINSPSITCFMLHAKSHSAGLTLVAATHVFLIEPFLYKGYEQQALARVHRIGQTRPTFVWRYIISDTVEEALVNANIGNSSELQKLGHRDLGEVVDGGFLENFFEPLLIER